MDDLVQFLRARLDEDEQTAGVAKPGPWHADGGSVYATHPTDEVVDYTESAAHIARHDPARVLAEVDAKRQILALWVNADWMLKETTEQTGTHSTNLNWMRSAYWEACARLAVPYANHPDYRPEWRP